MPQQFLNLSAFSYLQGIAVRAAHLACKMRWTAVRCSPKPPYKQVKMNLVVGDGSQTLTLSCRQIHCLSRWKLLVLSLSWEAITINKITEA